MAAGIRLTPMQVAGDPLSASLALTARAPLQRLGRWFGSLLAFACALLLAAEIVLLFVGLVARYAFGAPQVWVDELTSLLFLLVAMLGAVLPPRDGADMRLSGRRKTSSQIPAQTSPIAPVATNEIRQPKSATSHDTSSAPAEGPASEPLIQIDEASPRSERGAHSRIVR